MTIAKDSTLLRQVGALFRLSAQAMANFEAGSDKLSPVQRHKKYFETVLQTSPVAMVYLGLDRCVVSCNAAFEQLFGYSQNELVGHDLDELITTPATRGVATQYTREALEGLVHTTAQRYRKNGLALDVEFFGLPVTLSGEHVGTVGVYEDLTERKRAEAWLRLANTALESAANAIVICDTAGRVKWVNPAFGRLTGYSFEEVHDRTLNILKSGHHPPGFYQQLWETILAGHVWYGETTNKRKDGTLYIEEQTIAPVRDEHGALTHFISIKQDITARRAAEDARARLLAEIQRELAPLTQIVQFSERLQAELGAAGDLAPKFWPELQALHTTSEKLLELLKTLTETGPST